VTGGSGFIGRHVVRHLTEHGHDVFVLDLVAFPTPDTPCLLGDIRDRETVAEAIDDSVDAVVHLAAITSVLQSVKDPDGVYATNVLGTELLLERCRVVGVPRFVFASTNAVVGDVGSTPIDEATPLHPLTPYGATKASAEMLFWAYAASYGIITAAMRFTNVYGAGMQTKDSVVARLMKAALTGGHIEVYGNGEQRRDYLYVSDAAAAIEFGLEVLGAEVYTIGSGASVSMNALHALCCEVTGVAIPKRHVGPKPGEMPAVIVDTKKAALAGFRVAYDLRKGLETTWGDFKGSAAI